MHLLVMAAHVISTVSLAIKTYVLAVRVEDGFWLEVLLENILCSQTLASVIATFTVLELPRMFHFT